VSRFCFEDDDRARDLAGGTPQQQAVIYMVANEVAILTGCAHCGARLVHDNKQHAGARMVYPPGESKQTSIGTPLCGQCSRKAAK
jgi:hypothetical protein